jgi:hypothetical protein
MRLDSMARALCGFGRSRFLSVLLGGLLVALIAGTVNVVGIRVAGGVTGWAHWMQAHRVFFRIWRLCLYSGTAWGWWWMRERVRQREPGAERRLRRIELAAALTVVALECVELLARWSMPVHS